MIIYIMRHGTTVWNEKQIYQGHCNNRLSKDGIELVKQSAKSFSKVKFDVIYSSPLMRTIQTANIMNKFHNCRIIKDRRLIESDEGLFTRKIKANLTQKEIYVQNHRMEGYNMESWQNVYDRIADFANDIKNNCSYENILIVTHDIPATCLENILINKIIDYKQDLAYTTNFHNAEVRCYKL